MNFPHFKFWIALHFYILMSCCDCFKSSKKKKNDSDFDPVIIEQTHLNLNGVSVEVLSMGADDVLKKQ